MAVLEKIRVRFGLAISIIIALALLSFIIDPGTLEGALQGMSSKYDVGVINGKAIRYQDYQDDIQRYTQINEMMTGSSVQNEQQQKQVREAAWQELVDKYMFVKNAREAGITVGKAEMVDLTVGSNPSPIITQTFSSQEGFDPQNVVDFVQNTVSADETGRMQTLWNYIQNSVYNQQFYSKYGSLFTAGSYQNALEKAEMVAMNNTTADIEYVALSYPFEPDSTVKVSDSEIRSYYSAHKDFFRQRANRDIEYVVFEVVPSEKDIAAANDRISEVYEEFGATTNMKAFLLRNSDRQLSNRWYKAGELNSVNREVNDFVFGEAKGTSPIFKNADNVFFAARVLDAQNVSDSVYVKHILLQGANARQTADSLLGVVRKGADFPALAAQYSADQGSAADGELGSLGWLTQDYMFPGMESVITAKVNDPYVINTQYGTHVVVVTKKTAPVLKKQVAILEKASIASKETFGTYYSQANRFASIASHKLEGYNAAVDSLGVYSHNLNINEATENYGAIENAKEVTRWAFDAKAGKASDIITVNNRYFFVAAVKKIRKEGFAPVDEVSEQIRQMLYMKKLAQAKKAQVAEKIEGMSSLEDIAKALNTSVMHEEALSFSTTSRQLDPALVGAAFVAKDGEVCGPVAGAIATYVFRVNSRQQGSFFTEADAESQNMQKAQYNTQMIVPVMSDICDNKDNRARFF